MGSKNNKNKPISNVSSEQEFDVKRNLQKLRSGRGNNNYVTGQQNRSTSNATEIITNERKSDSFSTNDLLGLNDNMHLRYDKLKDDFNIEIKEIKKDHSNFAKEFTEKYISKGEFWIIIGGLLAILVTIAVLFYTISYQRVTNDIDSLNKTLPALSKEKIERSQKDTSK